MSPQRGVNPKKVSLLQRHKNLEAGQPVFAIFKILNASLQRQIEPDQ
jgi:hypothetical protein